MGLIKAIKRMFKKDKPDTRKLRISMRKCKKVIQSCTDMRMLNQTANWAMSALIQSTEDCYPCRTLKGTTRRVVKQQKVMRIVMRWRNERAATIPMIIEV